MNKVIASILVVGLLCAGLWAPVCAKTTITIYLTNAQGTPVIETNAQGTVIARAAYRPYGTQVLGMAKHGPGYTGHVNDPDTGLVYMQARYYDPGTGRFLSVDPVTPAPGNLFNFNRYDYANNNPIRYTDPDGRQSRIDITLRQEDMAVLHGEMTLKQKQANDRARAAGAVIGIAGLAGGAAADAAGAGALFRDPKSILLAWSMITGEDGAMTALEAQAARKAEVELSVKITKDIYERIKPLKINIPEPKPPLPPPPPPPSPLPLPKPLPPIPPIIE